MNPEQVTEGGDADRSNRTPKGRFVKGVSGNPGGRPKSELSLLRDQMKEAGQEIVKKVIDAAKAGDLNATRLILDRVIPPLKFQSAPITLALPQTNNLTEIGLHIIHNTASGEIPPDVSTQLITAIGTLARVNELEQLRERMEALELALSRTNQN